MKTICAFKERSLLIIVFLNLTIFILAQNGFYIKPQAQWVKKVQYNPNIETSPVDKDDGGTYLLVDIQQNVELEEIYKHNVVRIDEESGIQNYADIWIEYDPSYQTLHFHKLVIHRNNHELNRLKKEEFKIVQNESQLDSKIYTGNYSAGIYIEDVQLGDIIEYAYTIKGENPVFEGKCFEVFSLEYSIPIIKYFLQISYPAERNINYKLINSKIKPIKSFSNGLVFLTWDLDNCPEVVLNSNLPSWYIGYSKVQLSEFSSWREVIQWGSQLYPEQEIKNTSLEQKLQEITSKFSKKNDRINAIIRFVQDEIRYVGIEVNINSHKPHDPIEVYSKRYGDCKDKTYLLVTLLRNQGINARPAYVNTSLKQNILLYSPSPTVFNHVILSIEYDGELYFIDPTISNQRGDFKEAYIGNYKRALVLDLKYNEPVVVPLQASEKIVIDEYIEVEDSIMPVKYNITSHYYNGEADQIRSTFNSKTIKELEQSYLDFYDYLYPNMRHIDELRIEDDEKENIIKVYENYEIDKFWIFDSTPSINDYVASINPSSLEYYISKPSQRNRTMPFSIYHPIEIENRIEFKNSKEVTVKTVKGKINNSCFTFTYNIKSKRNKVIFNYSYKTLKDHVTIDEFEKYYGDIEKISDLIWYEFTYGLNENDDEKGKNINWLMIVLSIFFTTILIFITTKLYYTDTKIKSFRDSPMPIGGWLVLPIIGVYITPIYLFYSIWTSGFFDLESWEFMSSRASEGYNALWSFVFVFELLINIIFLVYSVFLIVLVVKRRTIFPGHFITFKIINLGLIIIATALAGYIDSEYFTPDNSSVKEIVKSFIGAAIWIPYMLISQRVKDTFIKKY